MNRKKIFIVGSIYCLFAVQIAHAEELTFQQIAARLNNNNIIRSDFDQTRNLMALKRPVKSNGKVIVAGKQGIIWQIDHPYRAKYVITMHDVIKIGPDGTRKSSFADRGKSLTQTAKLIGSLLDLNYKILSENFEIKISGDTNLWIIVLIPNQNLSKFISQITIQGSSFLETINIIEAKGDSTYLKFHTMRKDEPLSIEELKLLQGH
jgi:hypothetical protein